MALSNVRKREDEKQEGTRGDENVEVLVGNTPEEGDNLYRCY